jgi:hypothetical protein
MKTAYYQKLRNVTENNDWENYILYMLCMIEENTGNPKTVGNYLIALEENGFLKSVKVGKEKLYLNQQLLNILENRRV